MTFRWQLRTRSVDGVGGTPIMGILNVTPDSFSDGGCYSTAEDAIGAGLLGHAVARSLQSTWADALASRILAPLGLDATAPSAAPGLVAAVGHDGASRPVPSWDLDVLAGAGDLTSTANDMLDFLAAQLAPPPGSLGRAVRAKRVQPLTSVARWQRKHGRGKSRKVA